MRPQVAELAAMGIFPHELDTTAVDVSELASVIDLIVAQAASPHADPERMELLRHLPDHVGLLDDDS